ncbi:alanine racemase [Aliirhizobium smilacinae]|nr:alanine racemase [Rhizobium smilacinae]
MSHGPVLEVYLDHLVDNFNFVKNMAGAGVRTGAVVKSDAYGLGLTSVAHALYKSGCELFFVASLDEALKLRQSGILASIVVFDADIKRASGEFQRQKLVAVVNDRDDLKSIASAAGSMPYYLNIETGFSRFGLDVESVTSIERDGGFRHAWPVCLFTHLACSDNPQDGTNALQREKLLTASRAFPRVPLSLTASAGLWLDPSYHMDIARIGSALYGLNNARIYPNPLTPVVKLKAPVIDVHHVPVQQSVGYGGTFRTRRSSTLGVLPIGYKHGLPWACANRISVRLGSFIVPVVGRIAMEYTTIDLTDVPDAAKGRGRIVEFLFDEFGVDELASAAGANGQEILTRLGAGCPRNHIATALRSTG